MPAATITSTTYFNNIPERGKAIKFGNSPPWVKSPTKQQQEQLRELEGKLAAAESAYASLEPQIAAAQSEWEKSLRQAPPIAWSPTRDLVVHYPLDGDSLNTRDHARPGEFRDGQPAFAPGRVGRAGNFDGKRFVDAGNVADFGFYDKFSCGAWIFPKDERGGAVLSRMVDAAQAEGYALTLEGGRIHIHLVKRWLDDALRVESAERLPHGRWAHVLLTYDGSRVADGVKLYIDGKPARLRVLLDDLNQSFQTREPFRIGAGGGPENRFHGMIGDVRVYHRVLQAEEAAILATTDSINEIAALPPEKRTNGQTRKQRACYLEQHAPDAESNELLCAWFEWVLKTR